MCLSIGKVIIFLGAVLMPNSVGGPVIVNGVRGGDFAFPGRFTWYTNTSLVMNSYKPTPQRERTVVLKLLNLTKILLDFL